MKITPVKPHGLVVIELDVHKDSRGFFVERFNQEKFSQLDLPCNFVQDNHSRSAPGVLRGLHYQFDPPQGKLVGVTRGRIWDVAVDIRKDSSTYGQHFSIELTEDNGKLFWIPAGFAHGFCVLGDEPADVLYKVDQPYNQKGEGGLLWSDPDLKIKWPIENPLLSDKDKNWKMFS